MLLSEATKRSCVSCRKQLLLLFLVFTGITLSAQELIKDLNQMENQTESEYGEVVDANGTLYFTSSTELWMSNSSTEGAVMVKEFSQIRCLTNVAGILYFSANDGSSGYELWKTNGTTAGTVKIREIRPGAEGSDPQNLTPVNNMLYFVANDGATGRELWKSNGTAAGTMKVKDIMRITGSSNPTELTVVNDRLFFVANNSENGYELWRSDGTASGTNIVKDIYGGTKASSKPENLTNVNGVLYFSATHPTSGRELWKSDGTKSGTVSVKDILNGAAGSGIDNLVNVNGTLFFSANDKIHGEELWKSNGTSEGTVMVKDLTPGSRGSGYRGVFTADMNNFTAINNTLYFTAHGGNGHYFWKSDGTEAGTITMMEATGVGIVPIEPDFTLYKNEVYFFNGGGDYPVSLTLLRESSSDGSPEVVAGFYLNDYYESYNQPLVKSGDFLYLTAREGDSGYSVFQSDGTSSGTRVLIDTEVQTDQSSDPKQFLTIGNLMYFTTSYNNTIRVWVTDGSEEGTYDIANMESVGHLTNVNGQLYFVGQARHQHHRTIYTWDTNTRELSKLLLPEDDNLPHPYQLRAAGGKLFFQFNSDLWVTDGSSTASIIETDFSFMTLFGEGPGGKLLFSGHDPVIGTELWSTDGTPGGTRLVRDINPGTGSSFPEEPVFMNNIFYFKAYESHGTELWRSDGTSAGTFMLIDAGTNDTDPNTAGDDMRDMMAVNGTLYFTAMDASLKWWLWKTNGTTAGTSKIMVIPAPVYLLNGNDKLFFVAWDGTYGMWSTEGTAESTVKVRSFADRYSLNSTYAYVTVNNILYFTFLDEYLWRSDGTVCGTYELRELGGRPFPIEALDNEILFGMNKDDIGRELFKFNVSGQAPCSAMAMMNSSIGPETEKSISHYPNPFRSNFHLQVTGKDGGTYHAKILSKNNLQVEEFSTLMYNQPYDLGSDWSPGLYILIIREGEKMTAKKIFKN